MSSPLSAVAFTQDRRAPKSSKPTTVGQIQEAKPTEGVATEEIMGAALFPRLPKPWPLNSNWQIEPDPIPTAITDSNKVDVLTNHNRIGAHAIRVHDPEKNTSWSLSTYFRVGVTKFIHKVTGKVQITPGVNLFGEAQGTGFGASKLIVGAQQGTISETIGEENDVFTPANKFSVFSGFILPDKGKGLDGLLVLGVNRTVFPGLLVQYRLWGTDTQQLADITLAFQPSFSNPLSLALPTQQTLAFYRLSPGKLAEPIEFEEARKLKKQHKLQGAKNDVISNTLTSIKHNQMLMDELMKHDHI